MDRKDFLSQVGMTAAAFALAFCGSGCSKTDGGSTTGPSNVDFTLDLSSSANAPLQTNGGYLYSNGIIIARTLSGSYLAVQESCTHEDFSLVYQPSAHRFYCDGHGATFSESGTVINGPASRSLTQYNTTLSGTSLRVYS